MQKSVPQLPASLPFGEVTVDPYDIGVNLSNPPLRLKHLNGSEYEADFHISCRSICDRNNSCNGPDDPRLPMTSIHSYETNKKITKDASTPEQIRNREEADAAYDFLKTLDEHTFETLVRMRRDSQWRGISSKSPTTSSSRREVQ
jgi:hypothetical protein